MRRISGVLLAFTLAGCQLLGGKKTTSGWIVLDSAQSAKCGRWPLGEKDLAVRELKLVRGDKPGFLSSGIKRDASPSHSYLGFDGSVKMSRDDLQELKIGRSTLLAGGHSLGEVAVFGVAQNLKGKTSYELRNVRDNIVRMKGDLVAGNIQDIWLTSARGGQWITFKRDDAGNADFGVAYVDTRQPTKPTLKAVTTTFPEPPVLLPYGDKGEALAVWRDGETGQPFRVRSLAGVQGTAGETQTVDLAMASGLESWSAAFHNGSYYIAAIDGDSLIGQANLRVAAFSWGDGGANVRWTKDMPLKDVHVTEPVFHANGGRLQILVLKWVDEESTIARYNVAGGTIGQPAYAGIFKKGSRIVAAFPGEDEDDNYIVVRHRNDTGWNFDVCSL